MPVSSSQACRKRLVAFLRDLPPSMTERLRALRDRGTAVRERPDFLWHSLLSAMSTLGNSRGHVGLIENEANYRRVAFEALALQSDVSRLLELEAVLLSAKVRMPRLKARWLAQNHIRVQAMGGSHAATRLALQQVGRDAKLRFMKQFVGIGEKYARDIWMDAYDADFLDAIALDVRVRKLSTLLGFHEASYEEHERQYQALARDAGRDTWELDRIFYQYNADIVRLVSGRGSGTPNPAVKRTRCAPLRSPLTAHR